MNRFAASVGLFAVLLGISVFSTVRVAQARAEVEDIFAETELNVTLDRAESFWRKQSPFLHFLMDRDLLDEVDSALAEARALQKQGLYAEAASRCAWLRAYLVGILTAELPTLDNLF